MSEVFNIYPACMSAGQKRIQDLGSRFDDDYDVVARLAALALKFEAGAIILLQPKRPRLIGQYKTKSTAPIALVIENTLLAESLNIHGFSHIKLDQPTSNEALLPWKTATSLPMTLDEDPVGVILSFSKKEIEPIEPLQMKRLIKVKKFAEHLLSYRVQMDEFDDDIQY